MDLNEFQDQGYLQEVNRRFFHPLGLAMYVTVEDDGRVSGVGMYDDRGDPDGWHMYFGPGSGWPDPAEAQEKFVCRAQWMDEEWERRRPAREAVMGYMVQPPETGLTWSPELEKRDGPPDV